MQGQRARPHELEVPLPYHDAASPPARQPRARGQAGSSASALRWASWRLRFFLQGLSFGAIFCHENLYSLFNEKADDSLVFLHAAKAYKTLKIPNKINLIKKKINLMSISYFKLVTCTA